MAVKKMISTTLLIGGAACFAIGGYISKKVTQGEKTIANAQVGVDAVRDVSKLNPTAEKIGKVVVPPVQSKLDAGKETASKYKSLATWLKIGGIILFIVGAGALFRKRSEGFSVNR